MSTTTSATARCNRPVRRVGVARRYATLPCSSTCSANMLSPRRTTTRARMVTARSDGGGGSAQMRQEVEDAAKSVEPRREAIDGAQ